ncbi:hypothetical protein ACJJTC_004670 [Scirpophaga incertulas]
MPKRSAKSRIERYARKIRKLEEKEKRRKVVSPFDSSSESDNEAATRQGPSGQVEAVPENELDSELLFALGESTSESPEYGDSIHETLTKLWLPLLKKGMQPESKSKILKEYLVPDNCRLLQAPKLNAEISAAIPIWYATVTKRSQPLNSNLARCHRVNRGKLDRASSIPASEQGGERRLQEAANVFSCPSPVHGVGAAVSACCDPGQNTCPAQAHH